MITALLFAITASSGATLRAVAGRVANRKNGFAFGTLGVNLAGSFLLGLCHNITTPTLTIVGVGFLGTLTTFSSFARDVVAIAELRKFLLCATYLSLTLTGSVALSALGTHLVS